MKKRLLLLTCVMVLLFSPMGYASTLLWSDVHNYGCKDCPKLDFWVILNDKFIDYFDFSDLDYISIDRFDLTLTFRGTGGLQNWSVRVGPYDDALDVFSMEKTLFGKKEQTFSIYDSNESFQDTLDRHEFWFDFAGVSYTPVPPGFVLHSAGLNIYGQPVPVPAAVWLFATGLAGLFGVKRMRRTARG